MAEVGYTLQALQKLREATQDLIGKAVDDGSRGDLELALSDILERIEAREVSARQAENSERPIIGLL